MRKDAFITALITAVAGIFGAFFRWIENMNAFEADTGLMVPFAKTTVIMAACLIAAAAAFAVLAVAWTRRFTADRTAAALLTHTAFPELVCRVFGAALILLGLVLMFASPEQRHPALERLFAGTSIICGVAMMFITVKSETPAPANRSAALVPVLFCCAWLVLCYKNNAENPTVWAYLVELLTVAATVMAWYELAAYHYGRGKPAAALLFVQCAAFMNITTLTDSRPAVKSVMFAMQAALMLMYEFVLVENFVPRRHLKKSGEDAAQ